MAKMNIKLVKSLIGRKEKQIATAESLGLRKIGDTTVQPDNDPPAARSPRSATCCRSLKQKEVQQNETDELSPAAGSVRRPTARAAVTAPATARPQAAAQGPEGPQPAAVSVGFEGGQMPLAPPSSEARLQQHFCQSPWRRST